MLNCARHRNNIRHLLTVEATKTLVCDFILSKLGYRKCISLLFGFHQYILDKLKKYKTQQQD